MTKFEQSVADVLEVDAVALGDAFRDTEGWGSLKAFGLLVMMENEYQTPLTITAFQALETVRDLYAEAVMQLAARVFGTSREALTLQSAYGVTRGWDSVNHLRLTLEMERLFGVRYDISRIPALRTLSDFVMNYEL